MNDRSRSPLALVIEDEQDILELLASHLRGLGYWVAGAETGERGVDLALTDPPDVVMVDMMLPGIDGREVVRRLRADQRTRRCRIIICSVLDQADFTDIDADAVLAKPFVRSTVSRVVSEVTRQEET